MNSEYLELVRMASKGVLWDCLFRSNDPDGVAKTLYGIRKNFGYSKADAVKWCETIEKFWDYDALKQKYEEAQRLSTFSFNGD